MAKKRSMMSEQLKVEIAKELGFYDVVEREGWGGIKSRDAGNMVKHAIEMANRSLQQNQNNL
ncbi:small, acid-soluble spore protein, alpha/beta type [Filibacter tadaridae]|uniref:Small, acid-soluble spore proteins, alpha/beta type n=1 Tax=Filibacter tadaridae TaxID=2483811 RepID=A0A3P5WGK9_9BACL|nr:small, acid-soluble spore protein, alpha/beta type [Filibacter tadaridae]VDC18903.1 Small, acid-soluble spore proteins, alpha/beta type [Filibacter tadaridae]